MGKNNNNIKPQYIKTEIDYDKLADAIVRANKKIKAQEEKEAEKQRIAESEKWREIIGYTECKKSSKWICKKIHSIRNFFVVLFSTIFFKKKNAKTPRLSFELMRFGATIVYWLIEWLMYLAAMLLIVAPFAVENITSFSYITILYGLIAVLFARIIRIARLEIDNIKDREMLNTIFSATMAFIGVVLAVIALVVQLA